MKEYVQAFLNTEKVCRGGYNRERVESEREGTKKKNRQIDTFIHKYVRLSSNKKQEGDGGEGY